MLARTKKFQHPLKYGQGQQRLTWRTVVYQKAPLGTANNLKNRVKQKFAMVTLMKKDELRLRNSICDKTYLP